MTPTLSRRAYVVLDRLTKVVAVGLLAGALGGVAGSTADSIALGVAGLAVGLLTVFVDPVGEAPADDSGETPAADARERTSIPASSSDVEGFFDRFAHPRVALVATVGVVLWVGDFLLAAAGLALRGYDAMLAVDLFRLSGVVGAVGLLFVVVPAAYVGALYVRRLARTWRADGG